MTKLKKKKSVLRDWSRKFDLVLQMPDCDYTLNLSNSSWQDKLLNYWNMFEHVGVAAVLTQQAMAELKLDFKLFAIMLSLLIYIKGNNANK